jgi:hypothetical protein
VHILSRVSVVPNSDSPTLCFVSGVWNCQVDVPKSPSSLLPRAFELPASPSQLRLLIPPCVNLNSEAPILSVSVNLESLSRLRHCNDKSLTLSVSTPSLTSLKFPLSTIGVPSHLLPRRSFGSITYTRVTMDTCSPLRGCFYQLWAKGVHYEHAGREEVQKSFPTGNLFLKSLHGATVVSEYRASAPTARVTPLPFCCFISAYY